MPEYRYEARDKSGKRVRGSLVAADAFDMEERLTARNEFLIDYREIIPKATGQGGPTFFGGVNKGAVARFFDELRVFVEAGVVITSALDEVGSAVKDRRLRKIIQSVRHGIENGATLHDAMAEHPAVFDFMTLESIRVGEVSGTLAATLGAQAARMEKEVKVAAKVQKQSIYPAILISFITVLLIVLNVKVIPDLMESFKQFLPSGNPPPKTAAILKINNFMMDYGLIVPLGMIGFVVVWTLLEFSPRGKWAKDTLKYRLPVVRQTILFGTLVRMADGLRIGLGSGLQILTILSFLEKSVSNLVLRNKIREIRDDVANGSTLALAVSNSSLDSVFNSMVSAGEATGRLPYTMEKASDYYAAKIDVLIEVLFTVASALVFLVLGLIVAFAIMSIIIPMYELPTVL